MFVSFSFFENCDCSFVRIHSFWFELVEFVCDDGKSVFICFFIHEPGDERANERMNEWMIEQKRETLSEWMNGWKKWMNEVNKCANNHEWKNRIVIWKKLKMNEWKSYLLVKVKKKNRLENFSSFESRLAFKVLWNNQWTNLAD